MDDESYEPTPAEIRQRCEEIRRRWSPAEHRLRSTPRIEKGRRAVECRHWSPPVISVTPDVAAMMG
jgi:hypothetical protein